MQGLRKRIVSLTISQGLIFTICHLQFIYIDLVFLQGFDPGELEGEESDDSDDEGKYLPTLNKFVIAMVNQP